MLQFSRLSKRYADHVLFEDLSYTVGAGCVMLCDESGSGKSTLLSMLAGEVHADQGEVWLAGHALSNAAIEAKAALAYIPDDCLAVPLQTGREFLEAVASVKRTRLEGQALELADAFGLATHLDKRFEQMSLGTRKKIYLTASLIGNPQVVIADEPGSGLDAPSRAVLIALFKRLGEDRVVFFTSHDTAMAAACNAKVVRFADFV